MRKLLHAIHGMLKHNQPFDNSVFMSSQFIRTKGYFIQNGLDFEQSIYKIMVAIIFLP